MTKVGSLNCTSLEEKRWQRGCTCRVLPERIHHRRAAIGKPALDFLKGIVSGGLAYEAFPKGLEF